MIDWTSLSTGDTPLALQTYKKITREGYTGIFLRRHFGSSVLSFTGKFWAAIEENRGLARVRGFALQGFGVTRVDFAWDAEGAWMERARLELKGAITTIISPTGTTLYSGSRESARFLRVYDKRAEIKARTGYDPEIELTRVELETKREVCRAYLKLYENGKRQEILGDVLTRYGLTFLGGNSGQRICVARPDAGNPLEFCQRFYKVIGRALMADPDAFMQALELEGRAVIALTSPPGST